MIQARLIQFEENPTKGYANHSYLRCCGADACHLRSLCPNSPGTQRASRFNQQRSRSNQRPQTRALRRDLVDKALDPCNDFYKYSCNKWLTANPIPADQVYWSTGSGLELWNEGFFARRWKQPARTIPAAKPFSRRLATTGPLAWMRAVSKSLGLKPLQSELTRIAALKSKKDVTLEVAHMQHAFPGAWQPGDNAKQFPVVRLHRPAGLR